MSMVHCGPILSHCNDSLGRRTLKIHPAAPGEDLRESSQVNVIAATQGQVLQILQLFENQEAVSHQQGAVTETQRLSEILIETELRNPVHLRRTLYLKTHSN